MARVIRFVTPKSEYYTTSDGREFYSQIDALEHEYGSLIMKSPGALGGEYIAPDKTDFYYRSNALYYTWRLDEKDELFSVVGAEDLELNPVKGNGWLSW